MRLSEEFYRRPATMAAPELLGKILCCKRETEVIRSRITETECYFGEADSACHASKGKTPRTEVLYEAGGVAYVYLCYGIHHLLNVVTGGAGFPQAVLIRGIEGYDGPGKLTKYLQIDKTFNRESFLSSSRLWIEDDGKTPAYEATPRIGIDYAKKEDRERLWRFCIKEN